MPKQVYAGTDHAYETQAGEYPPLEEPLQLGQLAAGKGLLYGSSISPSRLGKSRTLWDAEPYAQLYRRQASLITCWNLQFDRTEPAPGKFDFSTSDQIFEFARKYRKKVRGHALCWHEHFPAWMSVLDRAAAIKALEAHIAAVGDRFAGRVHSWDVVNEGLNPSDGNPGGLRSSGFTRTIGLDWIEFAFRAARQADPRALLTYNEYRIEYTGYGDSDARRTALLTLLDNFAKRDVPIDAVGIQSHLQFAAWKNFRPEPFSRFLDQIASHGIKIIVTELDVTDNGMPTDFSERDRMIAEMYQTYLSVALANTSAIAVVNWGLYDPEAWQNHPNYAASPTFHRPDGLPGRGLPFGDDMKPKAAARAIAATFAAAPERSA
jgi:endo-1,4-beta-xylanase